jgi:hypothetical protein
MGLLNGFPQDIPGAQWTQATQIPKRHGPQKYKAVPEFCDPEWRN